MHKGRTETNQPPTVHKGKRMNNKERHEFGAALLDLQTSLTEAMTEAGGCMNGRFLQEMTVLELMCLLAPNNIRFIYISPES